jgi:predicted DCC family thiol-disulfide oxidoreductase YuxK
MAPSPTAPIVFYDGLCGFCDASVQWILRRDRDQQFLFAPLQGDTAAALLARHPELPKGIDSIIVLERDGGEEHVYLRSTAFFRILARLPRPWRGLAALRVLPRFLTDLGYRFMAWIRYRIWGRRESCRVPSPAERARFLP